MTKVSNNWQCPACGAGLGAKATDCCDYCILTVFSGEHRPELSEAFGKYNSVTDMVNDPTDYTDE